MLENGKMGCLRRVFEVIFGHNVINRHFFRGILRHFFSLIRGLRPANLDCRNTSGNDICCLGRSMIEMLGILAIIGVLSVGGIAGYSKAMEKFKTNQVIEQIVMVISNITTVFANEKSFSKIGELTQNSCMSKHTSDSVFQLLKSTNVFSDKDIKNEKIVNAFGGEVVIEMGVFGSDEIGDSHKTLIMTLTNLPKEACITIGTKDWGTELFAIALASGWNLLGAFNVCDCLTFMDASYEEVGMSVVDACFLDGVISNPIPPEIAARGCKCSSNTCLIQMAFRL
mgnify:CR=1 FL=1